MDNFLFYNIKSDLSVCALMVFKMLVSTFRKGLSACLTIAFLPAAALSACRQHAFLRPVCMPPANIPASESACRQPFFLLPSLSAGRKPVCLPQACLPAASLSAYSTVCLAAAKLSACRQPVCMPLAFLPAAKLSACRLPVCLPLACLPAAKLSACR